MNILHIASIDGGVYTGVSVAVPQHIKAQSRLENVGFVNIRNIHIDQITNQFDYVNENIIDYLPSPFSRPDLVVFHEIYHVEFVKISKVLIKNRIPYVIIPHGSLTQEAQNKKKIKKIFGNLLLFNHYIKSAVGIQYLSHEELERSDFGAFKFIGSNGIEIHDVFKKEYQCSGSIKFIYIGNLSIHIKGLDIMVNAIAQNKELFVKTKSTLDIYGPNTDTRHADLKKLIASSNLQDIIFVHDAISGENKINKLLSSDVFIQTSRSEGMSMGILEAMSLGLPCILTRGTNFKDILESQSIGWGAENNSDSVSVAIKRCFQDIYLASEKSKNARRFIINNYSWDIVAHDTIMEYNKIL